MWQFALLSLFGTSLASFMWQEEAHLRNSEIVADKNLSTAPEQADISPAADAGKGDFSKPANSTNLITGAGFSTDMQQMAPNTCFSTSVAYTSGITGYAKLDEAMTFSDLASELNIDVGVRVGFWLFSVSSTTDYLREVEDKEYTLSLSYLQMMHETVSLTLDGWGQEALNDIGQSFYANGTDPYFGLNCGDEYITEYEQGGMLIMNINIKFASQYEKTQFSEKIGVGIFFGLISVTTEIEHIATQYHIEGTAGLTAYQVGGDPSQLGKILSQDKSGNFYVTSCSITNMTSCTEAAAGLLEYARSDFTAQFANNTGMTSLGTGFMKKEPVYYLGLNTTSFVTPEVQAARDQLASLYHANQYYTQKSYQLIHGYPVPWDKASSLYKNITTLYEDAKNNVNILLDRYNTKIGAVDCYNTPDKCTSIATQLEGTITPIDLESVSLLKYSMPAFGNSLFLRSGDSISSWGFQSLGSFTFDSSTCTAYSGSADVTDNFYASSVLFGDGTTNWTTLYYGTSSFGSIYIGNFSNQYGNYENTIVKSESPYYFTEYNTTYVDAVEGSVGLDIDSWISVNMDSTPKMVTSVITYPTNPRSTSQSPATFRVAYTMDGEAWEWVDGGARFSVIANGTTFTTSVEAIAMRIYPDNNGDFRGLRFDAGYEEAS